jgi:hypothetical protein
MPLSDNNEITLLMLDADFREINTSSNKLIANEISDVKNMISKIIISTKTNKNRLKKLYKKDKKINTGLIKFNRNKDKDFLKIVADEINTIHNHHKKLEKKLEKNLNLYEKNKKIILDLENENKHLKTKDKVLNDFDQKILFYQNENIRLSSKLLLTEKQNKIINENLTISVNKKNELIKLIKDLNNHFLEKNILKTHFGKSKIESISDHKKVDLNKEVKKIQSKNDLNEVINKIFI